MRVALGIAYRGSAYHGWQSQPGGQTVQDQVERALSAFADRPVATVSAGRTDAGVHALNQVVHFDTVAERAQESWVRGSNRYLPGDIAIQWCRFVPDAFHSRANAKGRRYAYVLLESRGAAGARGRARRLDLPPARRRRDAGGGQRAARHPRLQRLPLGRVPVADAGEDAARASTIARRGDYWRFDFEADAFLHHMIRNIMGGLVAVGSGAPRRRPGSARCWPAGTARSPPRPSRPTACTSSARTTMPSMRSPSERRPCRGFPEAARRNGGRR